MTVVTTNCWVGQDATWYGDRLIGPGDITLDGRPSPHPEKWGIAAPTPIFGPRLLWQTAGLTKMPLGTEIGLGPGDIVR